MTPIEQLVLNSMHVYDTVRVCGVRRIEGLVNAGFAFDADFAIAIYNLEKKKEQNNVPT